MAVINGTGITYTCDSLEQFNQQLAAMQTIAYITNISSNQGTLTITFDLVNAAG